MHLRQSLEGQREEQGQLAGWQMEEVKRFTKLTTKGILSVSLSVSVSLCLFLSLSLSLSLSVSLSL